MTEARIAQRHDLPDLIHRLHDADHVCVDTEFHTERRYRPDLYLVQLALPDGTAWIIDPLEPDLLPALAEALVSRPAWLLHAGEQDLRLLRDALGDVAPVVHDTQIAAGLLEPHYPSTLGALLRRHVHVDLAKTATLSDWSRRPLDPSQLRYAAEDVLWLRSLWAALQARGTELGRLDLIDAACAEARDAALAPVDAGQSWRDLDAAGVLNGREALALKELLRWRDALGQAEDRPSRTLLGDAALRQLARCTPTGIGDLMAQRRLPRQFIKAHAPVLLEILAAATLRVSDQPRVTPPGSPASRRALVLRAFAEAEGAVHGFAAALLLRPSAREALAHRVRPHRDEVRAVLGPWRDALLGDTLDSALNGERAITLSDEDTMFVSIQTPSTKATTARSVPGDGSSGGPR